MSPRSGSATKRSPTGASATRSVLPRSGATLTAVTGAAGSPGPNSSSTDRPSAWARASATRSDGSEWPDSTADTACLLTPAMDASCCWEKPRAWRASRRLAPVLPGASVMCTDGRRSWGMKSEIIRVRTGTRDTVADITGECAEFARAASGGGDGLLHVFVPHATAGIALLEVGSGSDADLLSSLASLFPADDRWRHAHGSRGHGRSHVVPAFVAPYATVPVLGGRLALGTWQSIALVDVNVDNPDRQVRLSFLPG